MSNLLLSHTSGRYIGDGIFECEWEQSFKCSSVTPLGDIKIAYVIALNDVIIALDSIPERIDLVDGDRIILLDKKCCERYPEPYKFIEASTSKTVYKRED